MYDIFLSYSTKDRDQLQSLVTALEAEGWTVFWDHRSIKVAQDWHEVVGKAIQESTCVIVAWSESSVASRWVKEEALIARDRGVLYPIMLDQTALPFGFNLIQAADFTEWNEKTDHQEFLELKDQLSVRLNLQRTPVESALPSFPALKAGYMRPRAHEDSWPVPVAQGVLGKHNKVVKRGGSSQFPAVPGLGLTLFPGLALLVLVVGLVFWLLHSSMTSKMPDTTASQQRDFNESSIDEPLAKATAKPAVAPTPLKTYAISVTTEPAGAEIRINDKPFTLGQRFITGNYRVSAELEGFEVA